MEQLEQSETSPVILRKSRGWTFTWFREDMNKEQLEQLFRDGEVTAQLEICPKTQRKHWQGFVYMRNPVAFSNIKERIEGAHIEPARKNIAAKLYCQKIETRDPFQGKGDPLKGAPLHKWQEELLAYLEEPVNDREIIWYVDYEGGKGKTKFCQWLVRKKNALYLTGKASDIKFGIADYIKKKHTINILLLDFTRSVENFVSYQGIEEVKNGIFYSTKYESGMVDIEPPHVICFSNFNPDRSKLSKDRWRVIEI